SPMSGNICLMSCCFSSSRLSTMSFFGRFSRSRISTNFLPKEPVPPVINTVAFDQSKGSTCLSSRSMTFLPCDQLCDSVTGTFSLIEGRSQSRFPGLPHCLQQPVRIRSHQPVPTGFHCFDPLRFISQGNARDSQPIGLFLDPA